MPNPIALGTQSLPVTFTSPLTTTVAVNAVGGSAAVAADGCFGETLSSVSVPIPRVPRMPNIKGKKLCIQLQEPKLADEKLLRSMELLLLQNFEPSNEKFHAIERLEQQAGWEKAEIKTRNLLRIMSALGQKFGFSDLENTENLSKRSSADPLFIGLAGMHAKSPQSLETEGRLSLTEEGDFPVLQVFVNALHELVQQKVLQDYLPADLKFWVMFEGMSRAHFICPGDREEALSVDCVNVHPEVSELLREGKLMQTGIANLNNLLRPEIGVLGAESIDTAQLKEVIGTHAQGEKPGGSGRFSGVKEFCLWALQKLRDEYCNDVMLKQRGDDTLLSETQQMMQEMYGEALKKGEVHPVVLVLRGASHFFELPGVFDKSRPGCAILGRQMDFILQASPGRQEQPANGLAARVQEHCQPYV
ncbi:MAG: hypothetical protein V4623_10965 [Pseudomonadota bacterium]